MEQGLHHRIVQPENNINPKKNKKYTYLGFWLYQWIVYVEESWINLQKNMRSVSETETPSRRFNQKKSYYNA